MESENNSKYEDIEFNKAASSKRDNININKAYRQALEQQSIVDFTKIEQGDGEEFQKLKDFNPDNVDFQKSFYGECWDSRPQTFRDLDYVETKRKSLFKLDETNVDLLRIFDIVGFNFNSKNRVYASEIKFTGRHICNGKIYNYYNGISILYKVKLKRGGIVISSLQDLGATVAAQKGEVAYSYVAKGIQINPNATEAPKYTETGSGLFNDQTQIELDAKINYFLNEIAKKDGAFIGRPFPEDFELYISQ